MFYIVDLEGILINSTENEINLEDQQQIERMYFIFVRNRLLNMISTTLAHSSGQLNNQ